MYNIYNFVVCAPPRLAQQQQQRRRPRTSPEHEDRLQKKCPRLQQKIKNVYLPAQQDRKAHVGLTSDLWASRSHRRGIHSTFFVLQRAVFVQRSSRPMRGSSTRGAVELLSIYIYIYIYKRGGIQKIGSEDFVCFCHRNRRLRFSPRLTDYRTQLYILYKQLIFTIEISQVTTKTSGTLPYATPRVLGTTECLGGGTKLNTGTAEVFWKKDINRGELVKLLTCIVDSFIPRSVKLIQFIWDSVEEKLL